MIAVDLQALQSPAYATRGVGRYVTELFQAVERNHPDAVDWYLWNDRLDVGPAIESLKFSAPTKLRSFSSVRGQAVDVLHNPAPFSPLGRPPGELVDFTDVAAPVVARRHVVTAHDFIPIQFPERYLAEPSSRARYLSRLASVVSAHRVMTNSHATAGDAVDIAGCAAGRVTYVGTGVGENFTPAPRGADRRGNEMVGGRYVFVPAANEWRKNVESVLAAFARLPDAVRSDVSIVTGLNVSAEMEAQLRADAVTYGVSDDLHVAGYVSDDVLIDLYRDADLVVFASLAEGYGIPVAEARRCGARVIASDRGSLPEVLPDERARFDPEDVDALAALIARALTDQQFQVVLDEVALPDCSWAQVAARTVDVYHEERAAISAREPGQPQRIAVVSAMPPSTTGIADHTDRLVEAGVAAGADLRVYVPHPPARSGRTPHLRVDRLAALPGAFERGEVQTVWYCLGNGKVHRPILDMMAVVPGHVLVHDVEMPLMRWSGVDVDPLAHIARHAIEILVQSDHAADLVLERTGRRAINVGPHACWNDGDATSLADREVPTVASVGIAHEIKQTDRFVAAMHVIGLPNARGVIVGAGGERFVGPDDEIEVTGYVDATEFDRRIRSATVLVQLRAASNGESSGVVSHALARGVPLIVTDIGAMAELPDDVAVKVPVDITADGLAAEIVRLLQSPDRRAAMRAAGLAYAHRESAGAQFERVRAVLIDAGMAGWVGDAPDERT